MNFADLVTNAWAATQPNEFSGVIPSKFEKAIPDKLVEAFTNCPAEKSKLIESTTQPFESITDLVPPINSLTAKVVLVSVGLDNLYSPDCVGVAIGSAFSLILLATDISAAFAI